MKSRSRKTVAHTAMFAEHAFAALETAVWTVVIVPLLISATRLGVVLYDQSLIRSLADDVVRASTVRPLRWSPGARDAGFEVNASALRSFIETTALSARTTAQESLIGISAVSARACYWIFSVNRADGKLSNLLGSECRESGESADRIAFDAELTSARIEQRGIRLFDAADSEYAALAVLVGVRVEGIVQSFGLPGLESKIGGGKILMPRREVGL